MVLARSWAAGPRWRSAWWPPGRPEQAGRRRAAGRFPGGDGGHSAGLGAVPPQRPAAGLQLDSLPQVDFIYTVGPFSFIVALLAGAAGMLSLTSAKSSALVGVFISVTTVPAAAFAIVGAVEGRWTARCPSVLQLLVNLVGIVIAAVAVPLVAVPVGRSARKDGSAAVRRVVSMVMIRPAAALGRPTRRRPQSPWYAHSISPSSYSHAGTGRP